MKRFLKLLFVVCIALVGAAYPTVTYASDDHLIVVSMGDSYSSGEGIPNFYGQDSANKLQSQDWIAHRSQQSWAGQLMCTQGDDRLLLGLTKAEPSNVATKSGGILSNNYHYNYDNWSEGNWFFVAASGAETQHLFKSEQKKRINQLGILEDYTAWLAPQGDVFNYINRVYGKGSVDYVTVSIGGNDLGFQDIITTAATTSSRLEPYTLFWELENAKAYYEKGSFEVKDDETVHVPAIKDDIADVYRYIRYYAGSQAYIIVAGYPILFDGATKGLLLNKDEIQQINKTAAWLDEQLEALVDSLYDEFDGHLLYVSVVNEFAEHGAYSEQTLNPKSELINRIIVGAEFEDIDLGAAVSSYSVHPNVSGATKYAEKIQKYIDYIEGVKAKKRAEEEAARAAEEAAEKAAAREQIQAGIDEFTSRYESIKYDHENDSRLYGAMVDIAQAASDYNQNLKYLLNDLLDWIYVQPGCDVNYVSQRQAEWQQGLDAELDVISDEMAANPYSGFSYSINLNGTSETYREQRIEELLAYARSLL